MKVFGTVKDAATEVPLPGAKIKLYVREQLVAVLQSDSEGKFEHKSEAQYIQEILICKVEKAGYEPQKVTQEFKEDELTLEIKLVPKKEEKIELTVNLKDEKRNPLKGVKVSLEVNGEGVGVGISDKDGIFKISLSPDFEGKAINYKAELAGFELATGEVPLKKETSHEITLKKLPTPPPNRKWLKIAVGAAGIAAAILAAIIISQVIHPPELPVINSFNASPSKISAGEYSELRWSVSDASSVTIEPEIGSVALTGTRAVSPTETTTYTLTATNDAGSVDATVEVLVEEVNLPVINSFEASPNKISAGEYSELSWSVSYATSVTIDHEIGSVALTGTRAVSPTKTTTYTLTATNDAGSVDATLEVLVEEEEVNLPVINSFEASPSKISAGEYSELSWSVSYATSVTIEPRIGKFVGLTDTIEVSPTKTTTYTLTATNDAGSVKDTVIVRVLPTLSVITWDFETGDLSGWTKTGSAFDYQPTYGDNPTARQRGQPSKHQGFYWIGSYEKYPGPDSSYLPGTVQGDKPQGTLTSSTFTINTNEFNQISFLIGGGNHPWPTDPTCVNLEINGKMVKTAAGKNTETMERVTWYISSEYNGQEAVIKLYDMNSESWGYINFDDVKFEEIMLY